MMNKEITLKLDDIGMECMVFNASHEYKFYSGLAESRKEIGLTEIADEYAQKAKFWKGVLETLGAE